MPKLDAAVAKSVEDASSDIGFKPMPPGVYGARLESVDSKTTKYTGAPAWNLTFGELVSRDGESMRGKQFVWLNLPQDPDVVPATYKNGPEKWKNAQSMSTSRLKQFFEAFGAEPDVDTDELLGEHCALRVGVREAQRGMNQGKPENFVVEILPASVLGDDFDFSSSPDDDDDF